MVLGAPNAALGLCTSALLKCKGVGTQFEATDASPRSLNQSGTKCHISNSQPEVPYAKLLKCSNQGKKRVARKREDNVTSFRVTVIEIWWRFWMSRSPSLEKIDLMRDSISPGSKLESCRLAMILLPLGGSSSK